MGLAGRVEAAERPGLTSAEREELSRGAAGEPPLAARHLRHESTPTRRKQLAPGLGQTPSGGLSRRYGRIWGSANLDTQGLRDSLRFRIAPCEGLINWPNATCRNV